MASVYETRLEEKKQLRNEFENKHSLLSMQAYACLALNLGLALLMTYILPFLITTRQFLSLFFADFNDDKTFISKTKLFIILFIGGLTYHIFNCYAN